MAALRRLRRALPETRTRNLLHVSAGGFAFGLVDTLCWGGFAGLGTRDDLWMGGHVVMVMRWERVVGSSPGIFVPVYRLGHLVGLGVRGSLVLVVRSPLEV